MKENLPNELKIQEEDLRQKKSQFFLFFLLLTILLIFLTGLVFLNTGKKTLKQAANITQVPTQKYVIPVNKQTSLSLSQPPAVQTFVGNTIQIPIIISTSPATGEAGNNSLSAVQLSLNFDPKILQITQLTPGDFFSNPTVLLKNIDNQKGKISYALGSLKPQSGEKTLAILTVKLISITSPAGTKISFSSDTKAADVSEGSNNVLKSAIGLTLNIIPK